MHWTEKTIGLALQHTASIGQKLVVLPNCSWTGHEADMLVVEAGLRLIDIEIKISRADLKADAQKDKWWAKRHWSRQPSNHMRREWPPKVWKHYYALPADIWKPELVEALPSDKSGILLLQQATTKRLAKIQVFRRATPNREAKPISPADCLDLGRLANLRMWSALKQLRGIDCDQTPGAQHDPTDS